MFGVNILHSTALVREKKAVSALFLFQGLTFHCPVSCSQEALWASKWLCLTICRPDIEQEETQLGPWEMFLTNFFPPGYSRWRWNENSIRQRLGTCRTSSRKCMMNWTVPSDPRTGRRGLWLRYEGPSAEEAILGGPLSSGVFCIYLGSGGYLYVYLLLHFWMDSISWLGFLAAGTKQGFTQAAVNPHSSSQPPPCVALRHILEILSLVWTMHQNPSPDQEPSIWSYLCHLFMPVQSSFSFSF